MGQEVELSALDLRYESYRMKNPALEGRLLASIARRGIEEPLEGVDQAERSILLNGFKRYRCARKLGIGVAPYASLGDDEASAIINLLRVSNDRSLTILEQAGFIDELRQLHQMSVADIAEHYGSEKRDSRWQPVLPRTSCRPDRPTLQRLGQTRSGRGMAAQTALAPATPRQAAPDLFDEAGLECR